MTTVQDKAEQLLALLYGVGEQNVESVAVSGSAATFSTPDAYSVSVLTLSHATPTITIPLPNAVGQTKQVYLVQDATGSRIPTWAVSGGVATLTWLMGAAPTLQTAASAIDMVTLISLDGVNWIGIGSAQPGVTGTFTNITASGNGTIDGTLGVVGATTLSSTLASGALTVTGAATVSTTLGVTGTTTAAAINMSGNLAVATNKFTVAAASGNTVVAGSITGAGAFGVNGATAVGKSSAYTKTYSTQVRTIPAATYAAYTQVSSNTGVTNSSPYGFATAAELEYLVTDVAGLNTALAELAADVIAVKGLVVSLVVDLEAVGIAG